MKISKIRKSQTNSDVVDHVTSCPWIPGHKYISFRTFVVNVLEAVVVREQNICSFRKINQSTVRMQAATVQVSNRALETALEGDDVRSAAV